MQRTKNIIKKYLNRDYIWHRIKLNKNYQITFTRMGGKIVKSYEKRTDRGTWEILKCVSYEVSD